MAIPNLEDGLLAADSQTEQTDSATTGYGTLGNLFRNSGSVGKVQNIKYGYYNGSQSDGLVVEFSNVHKSNASLTPQYSENGKTMIGIKGTLEIETIIVDDTYSAAYREEADNAIPSTDYRMRQIRTILSTPGLSLTFELQGLGIVGVSGETSGATQSTTINDVGTVSSGYQLDLDNGPKIIDIQWSPITPLAATVKWTVSFLISECTNLLYVPVTRDITAKFSQSIDETGMAIRTIEGTMVVPQSHSASAATGSASEIDDARSILVSCFPPTTGFHRRWEINQNETGSTIDYRIVDTEIRGDNPYPPGIEDLSANLTSSTSMEGKGSMFGGNGWGSWQCRLTGSMSTVKGVCKVYAYLAAINMITYFIGKSGQGAKPRGYEVDPNIPAPTGGSQSSWGFITAVEFSDNLFDRDISFSADWFVMTDPTTLLTATGLFSPVNIPMNEITYQNGDSEIGSYSPGASSTELRWRNSVNSAQAPYGFDRLIFRSSEYPQLALCMTEGAPRPGSNHPQVSAHSCSFSETAYTGPGAAGTHYTDSYDELSVSESYLKTDITVAIMSKNKTFTTTQMGDIDAVNESAAIDRMLTDIKLPVNEDAGNAGQSELSAIPRHRSRKMGKTSYEVQLSGTITRVGYYPVIPDLATLGGASAKKIGDDVVVYNVVSRGSVTPGGRSYPMIAAYFEKRYVLDSYPTEPLAEEAGGNPLLNTQIVG